MGQIYVLERIGYILLCTDDAELMRFIDEVLRIVLRRDPCRGWRLPSINRESVPDTLGKKPHSEFSGTYT